MADNVVFQTSQRAWPPDGLSVETEEQIGGEQRQVIKVAESALPSGAATAANQTNGSQLSGALFYRSSDGTYQPARLDKSTNAIQVMDYEHHEIHAGSHFFIQSVVDLPINNVFDMQFTTPNTTKWAHLIFQLDCESESSWYVYEGVTINTTGTSTTPVNNDRNSATVSTMTVRTITNASVADANADTAVAGAVLIASGIIGAGRTGGDIERNREIILKQNTAYCFRLVANAAGYTSFVAEWYEHTNVG